MAANVVLSFNQITFRTTHDNLMMHNRRRADIELCSRRFSLTVCWSDPNLIIMDWSGTHAASVNVANQAVMETVIRLHHASHVLGSCGTLLILRCRSHP
jgi:hypothetical protein